MLLQTDRTRLSPETTVPVLNIHAAKTQLSRLVEDVAAGQDVVIARAGRPVARLVPFAPRAEEAGPRVLGRLAGRLRIPDDFDAELPEAVLAAFEGR